MYKNSRENVTSTTLISVVQVRVAQTPLQPDDNIADNMNDDVSTLHTNNNCVAAVNTVSNDKDQPHYVDVDIDNTPSTVFSTKTNFRSSTTSFVHPRPSELRGRENSSSSYVDTRNTNKVEASVSQFQVHSAKDVSSLEITLETEI